MSHARLSPDFLDTYRKAARAANSSLADSSGSLGDQVRASVPEEVSAAAETDPVTPVTQAPSEDAASDHVSSVAELPTDPDLDSALDLLEGDDMESFNRFLEHPEVQRLRPGGDPSQWQRDLEEQVRSISSNADQIAEIWRRVEGEAGSKAVHLVAEPTGGLVRAAFHPTAISLSPPTWSRPYAARRRDHQGGRHHRRGDPRTRLGAWSRNWSSPWSRTR